MSHVTNSKLSLIGTFNELNLDHLAAIRGCAGGSAGSKIERAMGPCNMALVDVSTRRARMPQWAENALKNCSSMADVRKVAEDFIKIRKSAMERLEHLDEVELNGTLAD